MDPWISYSSWRRDPLKGHESRKAVRASIRYARRHRSDLRIFAKDVGEAGQLMYFEVAPAEWDATFAEEN